MSFRPIALSIPVLSLFLFGSCRQPNTIQQADIRAAYSRYVEAVKKMDVPAYMAVFAPDF